MEDYFRGKKVLVTGGAGFIGTALARKYARSTRKWTVYDSLLPQVHGAGAVPALPDGVKLVVGDVRDKDCLSDTVAYAAPDVVVHLAAETGTGQSLSEPTRHTDVNVNGIATFFEALDKGDLPEEFVLASSRAVYGEGAWRGYSGELFYPGPRTKNMLEAGQWDFPDSVPVPSRAGVTQPQPSNVYGATKLAQENLAVAWTTARGVSSTILRFQNVYGTGQSPLNPYTGVVTFFIEQAKLGNAIPIFEDGNIMRDFVHIDDVVRAVGTASAVPGNVLADVGSGSAVSIYDMAHIVAYAYGAPQPVVTGEYRLGDVRSATCDMGGGEDVFGSVSHATFEEGLQKILTGIAV